MLSKQNDLLKTKKIYLFMLVKFIHTCAYVITLIAMKNRMGYDAEVVEPCKLLNLAVVVSRAEANCRLSV